MQKIFSIEEEDIVKENLKEADDGEVDGDDEEEENDSVEDISESDDEHLVVNLAPKRDVN